MKLAIGVLCTPLLALPLVRAAAIPSQPPPHPEQVQAHIFLEVEVDPITMPQYVAFTGSQAGLQYAESAQEYLYQGLHGWQGAAGAQKYDRMQSSYIFSPFLDVEVGTETPSNATITAALHTAINAYNQQGFGLQLDVVDPGSGSRPGSIKWERDGKQIRIRYDYDLSVVSGVQNGQDCNWLPFQSGVPIPPELQQFRDEGIELAYKAVVVIERSPAD